MPIVLGTGPVAHNYLELTNNVLQEAGELSVATVDGISGIPKLVAEWLNFVVHDIADRVNPPHFQASYIFGFGDGITDIPFPADFDISKSPPTDDQSPRSLTYVSPAQFETNYYRRDETGNPRYWTIWENAIRIYPAASEGYINGKVVYYTGNGNYYVCNTAHTSPGAGGDPSTDSRWTLLLWDDGGTQAADTYADSTDYEDGTARLLYYRRPVDMVNDGDVPDLPDRFKETIKIGALARLKERLMFNDFHVDFARYEGKIIGHRNTSKQSPMPRGFRLGRGRTYGR